MLIKRHGPGFGATRTGGLVDTDRVPRRHSPGGSPPRSAKALCDSARSQGTPSAPRAGHYVFVMTSSVHAGVNGAPVLPTDDFLAALKGETPFTSVLVASTSPS